jgi:alpha-L-fucosidase 2
MQHFWEQYAFTQDENFLREVAYPAMKEVCQYWEDRLKERADETLVVPDGWSPEHGPEEDGITYDQMLVWDLFNNFVEAARTLNVDKAYREKIADHRDRLLKPRTGRWGQLQEWEIDRDDPEDTHRHFSHMIGLHPGRQISPVTTPELADACKVALRFREKAMSQHPKYPHFWKLTGWSKAWRISLWARLHEAERAYAMLQELIRYRIYENLLSTCPPICLDAGFGLTAGIAEMLLQSHNRTPYEQVRMQNGLPAWEIHVLPALPKAWPAGEVKGLSARGGFSVDIAWADMRVEEVRIQSLGGRMCVVRSATKLTRVLDADRIEHVQRLDDKVIAFPTVAGETYVLKP